MMRLRAVAVSGVVFLAFVWAASALAVPPELDQRSVALSVVDVGRSLAGASHAGTYEGTLPPVTAANQPSAVALTVSGDDITGLLGWTTGVVGSCLGVSFEVAGKLKPIGLAEDRTKTVEFIGNASETRSGVGGSCPPGVPPGAVVVPPGDCFLTSAQTVHCYSTPATRKINLTITDGKLTGTVELPGGAVAFEATRAPSGGQDGTGGEGDETDDELGGCRAPAATKAGRVLIAKPPPVLFNFESRAFPKGARLESVGDVEKVTRNGAAKIAEAVFFRVKGAGQVRTAGFPGTPGCDQLLVGGRGAIAVTLKSTSEFSLFGIASRKFHMVFGLTKKLLKSGGYYRVKGKQKLLYLPVKVLKAPKSPGLRSAARKATRP